MKRGKYRKYDKWYGIYGIKFISHGSWADAEIRYRDYLINEHCVEDAMVVLYREEGYDDNDQEAFAKWMYDNRDRVKEECQYVIDNRELFGDYVQYIGH